VRFLAAALIVLGLALPAGGAARLAARSWATGKITRVSAATIAVRGTVSVSLKTETGSTSKTTLDGTRLLTCDVGSANIVRGYHVRNNVSIVCNGGVLSHIARAS
jgi:hypothetical protein